KSIFFQTTTTQKHMVKSRSKSTEEIQQAKKAFHIPQKSLPGGSELEKVKVSTQVKKGQVIKHQPEPTAYIIHQRHRSPLSIITAAVVSLLYCITYIV
uniref:Uncharacterized protein n=1 Tax=Astyanax mexicanus TaxID=7994 RepID=A0A3B1JPW0_ASTMX